MFSKNEDDKANQYIRARLKEARLEANKTQDDLANLLQKSRVTISDMERGRVAVSASDLALIAAALDKPISYFFPPRVSYPKEELTPLHEELLTLFDQLPYTQQQIALEYTKQQVQITQKAKERTIFEETHKIQ
jgi:transcriptional regulator with XRE-family HTH domain